MAGVNKQQLGSSFTRLGFSFLLPMGVIAVTPEKRAKALDNLMAGTPTIFAEYRKFLGFLEHLLAVIGGDRTYMNRMYGDNFRRGARFRAATTMVLEAPVHQEHSTRSAYGDGRRPCFAGSFLSSALSSDAVAAPPFPTHAVSSGAQLRALRSPPPPPDFYLFSDAANEAAAAGQGRWVHSE